MKKLLIAGLVLFGISTISSAHAQGELRAGLGIGIPYGILGGNLEYRANEVIALTGGVGINPAGLGWSVGARIYMPGMGNFKPRLTALHGVVAILETRYWGGDSDYESLTGEAFGIGFGWTMSSGYTLEFDLLSVNADTPPGTIEKGGSVKISIGVSTSFN
ncbi:hypothetical protein MNBD_GAMMA18-1374 [hydrothermal vent metagenome]|uniref:Outer membrane protein beta-barrel domain-containing protein n=1 Tax=hydrothermal vent metagenome TaxID=652676 RepID=A0A3B0ZKS8_9ZZZZ